MRSHELTHNTLTISFFSKYVVANDSVRSGFALKGGTLLLLLLLEGLHRLIDLVIHLRR